MTEQIVKLPEKLSSAIKRLVRDCIQDPGDLLRASLEQCREDARQREVITEELRSQKQEIATLKGDIAETRRRIRQLRRELSRWLDLVHFSLLSCQRLQSSLQERQEGIGFLAQGMLLRADSAALQVSQIIGRFREAERRSMGLGEHLKSRLVCVRDRLQQLIAALTPLPPSDPLCRQSLLAVPITVHISMEDLVEILFRHEAEQLLLKPGRPPVLTSGTQVFSLDRPKLDGPEIFRLALLSLSQEQRERFVIERRLRLFRQRNSRGYTLDLFTDCGQVNVWLERAPSPDTLEFPPLIREWAQRPAGMVILCSDSRRHRHAAAYGFLDLVAQYRAARIFILESERTERFEPKLGHAIHWQRGEDFRALGDLWRLRPEVVFIDRLESSEEYAQIVHWASHNCLILVGSLARGLAECVEEYLKFPNLQLALTLTGIVSCEPDGRLEVLANSPSVTSALTRGDLESLQDHLGLVRERATVESSEDEPMVGWI